MRIERQRSLEFYNDEGLADDFKIQASSAVKTSPIIV